MGIAGESGKLFPAGWGAVTAARPCDACESSAAVVFSRPDSAFLCAGCDGGRSSARVWMCEVCEQAPAAVTCKADAASLCAACDRDIHSANPLARRHDRVPLAAPTKPFFADNSRTADDPADDDSEEAEEAASWILPHGSIQKFSDEPDLKPSDDILFADSVETFFDFDYSRFGAGTADGVVPVETTTRALAPPSCFDLDFGSMPNLSPYTYTTGTATQSVSQSVSSDVGVVPEGTASMSDASYTFGKAVTGGGSGDPLSAAGQATQLSGSEREARVMRYREKRKNRKFEKTIRYASRKAYAEMRPRIKGRFAKRAEVDNGFYGGGGSSAPPTFAVVDAGYGVVPSF